MMGDPSSWFEAQRLYANIASDIIAQGESAEHAVEQATIAVEGFIKLFHLTNKEAK